MATTHSLSVMHDQHGEWCAHCLQYISLLAPPGTARGLERHHLIGQSFVRRALPDFPLLGTVPAHYECHRDALQPLADDVTTALKRQLGFAGPKEYQLSFRELAAVGGSLYRDGFFPASLIVHEHLRRAARRAGSYDRLELDADQVVEYSLSSSGSSRGARRSAETLVAPPRNRTTIVRQGPLFWLQAASVFSDQSRPQRAAEYFSRANALAQAEPRRRRETYLPSMLKRETQVFRSPRPAERALRILDDHRTPFGDMTARVLAGWAYLDRANTRRSGSVFSVAQQRFEEVLSNPACPWLYEAECRFGLACVGLQSDRRQANLQRAYKLLVQAQYIYGMLGAQPTCHTDLAGFRGIVDISSYAPSHVLQHVSDFYRMRRDLCTELRRTAIRLEEADGRGRLQERVIRYLSRVLR